MTPTIEIRADGVRVLSGGAVDRPVPPGLAESALEWIDEPIGLHAERPVAVADLWRSVMVAALGEQCDSVVLVHPDDWPRYRIARVVAAANAVADEVESVPRRLWVPSGDGAEVTRLTPRRRPGAVTASAVGIGLSALAAVALMAVGSPRGAPSRPPVGVQTVVEGRLAVEVPPDWAVTRVTGGPGSRRLQAGPPGDPDIAVHITQSYAPGSTLRQAADALSSRIAEQPSGVFVDFHPEGSAAGRPAVTYREMRPGRAVDWSVVLIGSTVIGVGCQSAPRDACERVLASARERGTDPRP